MTKKLEFSGALRRISDPHFRAGLVPSHFQIRCGAAGNVLMQSSAYNDAKNQTMIAQPIHNLSHLKFMRALSILKKYTCRMAQKFGTLFVRLQVLTDFQTFSSVRIRRTNFNNDPI